MTQIAKLVVQAVLRWAAQRTITIEHPLVIGVTGSSGKTSTKEAIGHVLRATVGHRTIRTAPGNLNTEFGLPLVILGLPVPVGPVAWVQTVVSALWRGLTVTRSSKPVVYVLEYGVQQPGDMKQLLGIVSPTVAVVTTIGVVHFGSIAATAREKGQLIRSLPEAGTAILNRSDPQVATLAKSARAEVVWVHGTPRELSRSIAVTVAQHVFGIPVAQATEALRTWQPPSGRLRLLRGIRGSWLLDDSYNANPQSMTLALAELRRLGTEKRARRRVAVLGDMLELGQAEHKDHLGIALLAEQVAEFVVFVGPRFRQTRRGTEWFPGPIQAAEFLHGIIRSGDLILVKGSQGMRMEKVSEQLLDRRLDPAAVLVRQTDDWKRRPYVTP